MIHKSVVKSVLSYGAVTWSLYEDDRRRINATEMDALRRSAGISKLDRKTKEYIGEKMDAPDTILDEITRKQLIWYGHVERMDPTRLPKIMINWRPEGRKKRGRPRRHWKDGIIQPWAKEIWEWANGTIEGNGIWKSEGVARRFKTAYIYIYIYIKPITSYMFRCLLHHLQGDHCVTCTRTICFFPMSDKL